MDDRPQLKRISYAKPALAGLRGISTLATTDVLSAIVQILAPGARQGLHAHGSYDGFYFVLAGRARFYGRDNALFAEIGPTRPSSSRATPPMPSRRPGKTSSCWRSTSLTRPPPKRSRPTRTAPILSISSSSPPTGRA